MKQNRGMHCMKSGGKTKRYPCGGQTKAYSGGGKTTARGGGAATKGLSFSKNG